MSKGYIDFAAVKAGVTISMVLERYGLMAELKPCGADSLRGARPIHKGENPKEFSVSLSKNCWHCFYSHCNGGGNVLDLVAQLDGTDVHEAAHRIDGWFQLGLDRASTRKGKSRAHPAPPRDESSREDNPTENADAPEPEPKSSEEEIPRINQPLGFQLKGLESDHSYFVERGLDAQTVEHFELGFCKKGTMAGRVVIPLHNCRGGLVGYAGRWPGNPPDGRPKYKLPKGFHKSLEVFNLHRLGDLCDLEPLVIVEGYFDCMWLWQHGYRDCVALAGSAMSDAQEDAIVERLAECEVPHVEVLFDEDEAGRKGREDILNRLAPHGFVRALSLDAEGRQPDGLSADELQALIG